MVKEGYGSLIQLFLVSLWVSNLVHMLFYWSLSFNNAFSYTLFSFLFEPFMYYLLLTILSGVVRFIISKHH